MWRNIVAANLFLSAAVFSRVLAAPVDRAELIKAELTKQVPQCDTVAENAARLLLKKADARDTVVAEWKNLCEHSILFRLYELADNLDRINADSPQIDSALWTMLRSPRKYRKKARPEAELGELLRERAQKAQPRSQDGKLLKTWFVNGDQSFRSELAKATTGALYRFYRADLDAAQNGTFVSMTFSAGGMFPSGGLSPLGNHASLGFGIFGGHNRISAGLIFDFRFVNTPSNYTFYNPNTNNLEQTNSFFALFLGPDIRWEFLRAEQFSLYAIAGFGYDLISHYAAPRYSGARSAYSESFNLNGGLAFRTYFSDERAAYLDLELRAHNASYSDGGKGGDKFAGIYFTAALAAGYKFNFDAL